MALIKYSLTLVAKQDAPFNVLPNTDVTIRRVSDNGLVLIYSDSDGLIPIAQPGAKTNPRGVFEFYTDSLPIVKAVWSDGGNTYEEVFNGNSLQALSGLTEPSDLDQTHRTEATLTRLAAGDYAAGSKLVFAELGDAPFDVVAGGAPNGFDIRDAGSGNTAVLRITDGVYNALHFGVDGSGVTSSDSAYLAVKSASEIAKKPVYFGNSIVKFSNPQELPAYGIEGDVQFVGEITLTNKRKTFTQQGVFSGDNTTTDLTISGTQYAKFDQIKAPFTFTIDGGAPDRGTFWNDFGPIEAGGKVMNIDTGQGQSINQNTFRQTRCGVHIFGGSGGAFEECDNNMFFGLDTTGADITDVSDGSTGWHLLNNSFINQRNNVFGWYAEGSGRRAAKGNFNIVSPYVDSTGNSPYAIERGNYVLFSPDHSTRAQSDFLPISHFNAVKGGSWDILDANGAGQPVGVNVSGGTAAAVVSDATEPSGLGYKFGGVNTVDFRSITIKLPNNYHGRYTLCFWLQVVGGSPSAQTLRNGSPQTHTLDVYKEAPNNWRLYRISTATRTDGVDDLFQLFFRAPSTEMYISTVWGTPEKAAMIPYPATPETRIGISNNGAVSNVPSALPVGGRIKNYDAGLTTGQPVEWAKRADNTAQIVLTMP